MRIIESFQNLPTWITNNLDKSSLRILDRKGIDLYNCTCEEIDVSEMRVRDPRWSDEDNVVVILLKDLYKNKLYVYDNTEQWEISNPFILNANKNASGNPRKWLLDNALNIAIIKKSDNKKPEKDHYIDDRNVKNYRLSKHQKYAGQRAYTRDGVTTYYGTSGRDKSGYVIPDPTDKLKKLYQINLDNYADVIKRYYNKLTNIKSRVFDIDIEDVSDNSEYYKLLSRLGESVESYKNLQKSIDRIISKYNELPKEEQTPERFEEAVKWIYYDRKLNDNIIELYDLMNKVKG